MTLTHFFKATFFAMLILTAVSCSKSDDNEIKYDPENPLIGVWVNSVYSDTVYTMKRATSFSDTCDGFEFKADGTLLRRANSGDCGTPPIVYANYEGTFTILDDKSVYIETEYWGGSTVMHFNIVSVDGEKLVYSFLR